MRRLIIGKKLYFAFGVLLALSIIVEGVSIFRLNSIAEALLELQTAYYHITDAAMETQIDLLTARRHEKDFIAHIDKKYINRMDKTMESLKGHIDELAETAYHLQLTDISKMSNQVVQAGNVYKFAFDKIYRLIQARGNKSSGIKGKLRKHAQEIEDTIKMTASPALMGDYLLMRRHENDFLLRQDDKYVKKTIEILESLKNRASENALPRESMEMITKSAAAYMNTFGELSKNTADMNIQYPIMRQAAHNIENVLKKIEENVTAMVDTKQAEIINKKEATTTFLYIFCVIIVLASIFLSFSSVRSTIKPLNRIIEGYSEGSD